MTNEDKFSRFWIYFFATRPAFLTASAAPVLVGSALGFAFTDTFSISLFLLALFATMLLHSGANVANDYYDYLFGNDQSVAAVHAYRQTMDYNRFIKLLKIEPHLIPLLSKIRPRLKTAIATNRSDTMNRLLAEFNLTEQFDLVVTSFDIPRPKPYPDSLLKILSYFNIVPHQALYVGDSPVDAEAALAAKIPFVAYRNRTLATPYHIENLKDLEKVVEV